MEIKIPKFFEIFSFVVSLYKTYVFISVRINNKISKPGGIFTPTRSRFHVRYFFRFLSIYGCNLIRSFAISDALTKKLSVTFLPYLERFHQFQNNELSKRIFSSLILSQIGKSIYYIPLIV